VTSGNRWIFKRQVRWGECDPAGVVYTPRFADYVAEAHLAFFQYLFAMPPYEVFDPSRMALPAKAISIEFKRPLRPNDWFDVHVFVGEIRTKTYDLDMIAKNADGIELFIAKFTLICLDQNIKKAVPLPHLLRNKLMEFHRGSIRSNDSLELQGATS
jgi:YbgC/YbaW family acyl-CoA thioester hydrolase